MPDAAGPYTVERRNLVIVGSDPEPIESSWECQSPLGNLGDAETVARTLALRADGDEEFRVLDANRSVLSTWRVTRRLEVLRPVVGAPDCVEQEELQAGLVIPLLSEALAQPPQGR